MAKFSVLCLTVCLAYIHSSYALKCYSCDSTRVPACLDGSDLKNVALTECSTTSGSPGVTEASCMKITTQAVNNGPVNTTRKCVMHPHGVDACVSARGKLPANMELKFCEMCTTDGCNAAGSIGAPLYAIVALCLATIARYVRN
ncbi:uncharacterized protein CBL_09148 [Carabus blaptoides fortunei]